MRQRRFAREVGWVALVFGFVTVGCSILGGEESTDDDDDDNGGGTAGVAGGPPRGGTSSGGAAGTGISGSATGGSVTGGVGGTFAGGGGVSGSGGGGAVGTGGGGGMPMIGDISWNETGYIDMTMNTFGINGSWFAYNDCNDAMQAMVPCTMPDALLTGPDGNPGWATTPAQVCMKGTAAQVMMTPDGGTVDYFGIQWGAGIAFDLSNAGGVGAVAMPFNATAAGIAGFIFDVTGTAPMRVRINYVMPTTESTSHFIEVEPGTNISVDFLSVNQGAWVMDPNRVAFDPTQFRTIQFQVFTNDMSTTPYDFCVSNVRVIRVPM